jgi:ATP-binding protein involved in chromosome partitioning
MAGMSGPTSVPHVRHIVAVASGKGGVGKSTTAVNVAAALALQELRVGVLDADIYGPSQPRMLGMAGAQPESDGQHINPVLAALSGPGGKVTIPVMSMGFLVDETTPTVWRGPMVQSALMQMLRQVVWGTAEKPLDILILDMPPGTGDAQLSITQQVALSGAVIVSTPQDIALIDARKGLEMFKKVNVPILGLVENMSHFCCPACGHEAPIFGRGGAKALAAELGLPLLAEVPLALEVREHTDSGLPLVISVPESIAAAAYRGLAAQVWAAVNAPARKISSVKIVLE